MPETYSLGNGVARRRGLLDMQRQRYAEPENRNLHKPVGDERLEKRPEAYGRTASVLLDVNAAIRFCSTVVKKKWPGVAFAATGPGVLPQ